MIEKARLPAPQKVDIALDHDLVDRYGLRIPVLVSTAADGTRKELDWPFDENKLHDFLST